MKQKLHQSLTFNVEGENIKVGRADVTCPVCNDGKDTDTAIYDFDSISIVKCSNCSTMHLKPMPDEESLKSIYNNNYYNDKEQVHGYYDYAAEVRSIEKTYSKRLKFVKEVLGLSVIRTAQFHEIGCALGIGLSVINNEFSTLASGSDISKDAEQACKVKGFPFSRSDSLGRHNFGDRQKDIVLIFDVIEHLSDIQEFVAFLGDFVSENGYVVITTPNMDDPFNKLLGSRSPSIKIPQHTIYFTTDTLIKALDERFVLVKSKRDYQYSPISRIFERLSHIFGLKFKLLKRCNTDLLIPNGMSVYTFKKRPAFHG
ncbi:MAG: methyltransferase domain-containing protein [Methylomarinum sp.]|nr:methyltransferase domain-containing protein [Methylomarinum sp.]